MIYAIGDSFTYGDELSSQDLAWPALLGKKLDKEVINKGRPATGNNRMVKRAIDAVINQAEMVIIGWSDCNRQEFADEKGIYDLWAGRNFRSFLDDSHRIGIVKYMTAYDMPEYFYAKWLRKIILVQNLCKHNNIPCVMFISCGANESHDLYSKNFSHLMSAIDKSFFVSTMSTSVAEWTWGTPHGPNGHPLEAGHEIIAQKIYEHIRNKCWIS
jgi:lysophospholipase L1-like esterase